MNKTELLKKFEKRNSTLLFDESTIKTLKKQFKNRNKMSITDIFTENTHFEGMCQALDYLRRSGNIYYDKGTFYKI
jgi:hypothetical protein